MTRLQFCKTAMVVAVIGAIIIVRWTHVAGIRSDNIACKLLDLNGEYREIRHTDLPGDIIHESCAAMRSMDRLFLLGVTVSVVIIGALCAFPKRYPDPIASRPPVERERIKRVRRIPLAVGVSFVVIVLATLAGYVSRRGALHRATDETTYIAARWGHVPTDPIRIQLEWIYPDGLWKVYLPVPHWRIECEYQKGITTILVSPLGRTRGVSWREKPN